MKLSLRWIFDHIDADWKKLSLEKFVDKINQTTAEIERIEKIKLNLSSFSLVVVTSIDGDTISVTSSEWKKDISLPFRADAVLNNLYLIKKDGDAYVWAQLIDFHCSKEGFVPAVSCDEPFIAGKWKKMVEFEDYILEVDNTSITHRPDMWGHRGFAREIAAIFDLPFVSFDKLIKKIKVQDSTHSYKATSAQDFSIKIQDKEIGKRFAGLFFPQIRNRPSSLFIAFRLMLVGSRPIDSIVDVTNYVMLDISQPMHAFDSATLPAKTVLPRLARSGEKLVLLDDVEIELSSTDYVITDGKKPIALAGIMGGKETGISAGTNSIFLESANFDASTIRKTALRLGIRTDASARFEKSLDPNQNVPAIFRLLKIFEDEKIEYNCTEQIASLGEKAKEKKILVSHDFIQKRLGAKIEQDFIVKTLEKLEFGVEKEGEGENVEYEITVPTFRCSKDVTIEENIVEEVGRFFGYENIKCDLPKKETTAYDLTPILRARKIKRQLAYGLKMHEVCNYPFYDESFLRKLHWEPKNFAEVSNPVSENFKRLETSLIPHLIKNIDQNISKYDKLRFFEWARVWEKKSGPITEQKALAGIFFDVKNVDFYCAKSWLTTLFDLLDMDVTWEKVDERKLKEKAPWFFPCQTAKLMCSGKQIGVAGKLDPAFFSPLFEGDAFAFELDGDFLLSYKSVEKTFKPLSKYPESIRDVSMFVPLSITVQKLNEAIKSCDERIADAYLVDFFQKDEWKDKKALTFRFIIQDYNKTLEKQEVDSVYDIVIKKLEKLGAALR